MRGRIYFTSSAVSHKFSLYMKYSIYPNGENYVVLKDVDGVFIPISELEYGTSNMRHVHDYLSPAISELAKSQPTIHDSKSPETTTPTIQVCHFSKISRQLKAKRNIPFFAFMSLASKHYTRPPIPPHRRDPT